MTLETQSQGMKYAFARLLHIRIARADFSCVHCAGVQRQQAKATKNNNKKRTLQIQELNLCKFLPLFKLLHTNPPKSKNKISSEDTLLKYASARQWLQLFLRELHQYRRNSLVPTCITTRTLLSSLLVLEVKRYNDQMAWDDNWGLWGFSAVWKVALKRSGFWLFTVLTWVIATAQ